MNQPPAFRFLCATGALALLAVAVVPLATQAQSSRTSHRSNPPTVAAAATPASTPAITVAPRDDEENEPVPPRDAEPGTPEATETEILATEGATFASKDRIAVFTGNVRVTDPRFQLSCDKLTVFLNKTSNSDTPGAAATPKPDNTPPPRVKGSPAAPAPTPGNSGGIDHAIAEGHVIIVQERAATQGGEAKRSVGRSDWAYFDNKTGDMVLKGSPRVEQNENTHTAMSPDTVMTLRKDNSLTTIGPSRTIIIQRKGSELPGSTPGASPVARPASSPARTGQPANGHRTRGGATSPAPGTASASR
jgi:lipopolysaccharide export system protein LptA